MRNSRLNVATMIAAAGLAMAALSDGPEIFPNGPRKASRRRPHVQTMQISSDPEIAAWNAAVDARKAEKRARKEAA